jgi:hypothetical protein
MFINALTVKEPKTVFLDGFWQFFASILRRASEGNPTSGPGSSYSLWKAQQLNLGPVMPRIQISVNQFGRILNHPRDTFHTEVRGHSLDIIFTGGHPISGQVGQYQALPL